MTLVPVPPWNAGGVLPPVLPGGATGLLRSPYPVSLTDLAVRFATSPERRSILLGFLEYRAALHRLAFTVGFQWIDGSFMEDVERVELRPPRDLDVVTFLHTPDGDERDDADLTVIDHDVARRRYHVDAYLVELDAVAPRELTFWSAYWYSIWSHRRDFVWKGFLQVELAPDEDAAALRVVLGEAS